jgi:hypothetical protein
LNYRIGSSERYGMQFNSEKIITNFESPISGKEYRQYADIPAQGKKKPAINRRLFMESCSAI